MQQGPSKSRLFERATMATDVKLSCFYGSAYGVCKKCKDFFFSQVNTSPDQKPRQQRASTRLRLRCCEAAGMRRDKVGSGRQLFSSEGVDTSTYGNRCAVCVLLESNAGREADAPLTTNAPEDVVLPAELVATCTLDRLEATLVAAPPAVAPAAPNAQPWAPDMFEQECHQFRGADAYSQLEDSNDVEDFCRLQTNAAGQSHFVLSNSFDGASCSSISVALSTDAHVSPLELELLDFDGLLPDGL